MSSVVLILRGLPGSGKDFFIDNRLAAWCAENGMVLPPRYTVCSADNFFKDQDGNYLFEPNMLPVAHASCLSLFVESLIRGERLIIVNNTNTQRWEFENYEAIAKMVDAKVFIEEMHRDAHSLTIDDVRMFNRRCSHDVPLSTMLSMAARWEL